jgi:hypothetical protein
MRILSIRISFSIFQTAVLYTLSKNYNFERGPFKPCKVNIFTTKSPTHMMTLWCKNQENLSDRISHAWAPLKKRNLALISKLYTNRDGPNGIRRGPVETES